jgi:hypothetical protein
MKRADAQKWCLSRGITPSEAELKRTLTRLEWAKASGLDDRIERAMRSRLRHLGEALGYHENIEREPEGAAEAVADEQQEQPQAQPERPARARRAAGAPSNGQTEGEGQ